jgi:hypothetical protein
MTRTAPIPSNHRLSAQACRDLQCFVGRLLPASTAYGVPGADDPDIFNEILYDCAAESQLVHTLLQQLELLAAGAFADLDAIRQTDAAQRLHDTQGTLFMAMFGIAARCYYRDDRVMRALGMALRPPFPHGFELEPGDWTLLDPVRLRTSMVRPMP